MSDRPLDPCRASATRRLAQPGLMRRQEQRRWRSAPLPRSTQSVALLPAGRVQTADKEIADRRSPKRDEPQSRSRAAVAAERSAARMERAGPRQTTPETMWLRPTAVQ